MVQTNKQKYLFIIFNWLLLILAVLFLIAFTTGWMPQVVPSFSYYFDQKSVYAYCIQIFLAFSFIVQIAHMHQVPHTRLYASWQIKAIVFASTVVCIALLAGDLSGIISFNNNKIYSYLFIILPILFIQVLVWLMILGSIGNAILFITQPTPKKQLVIKHIFQIIIVLLTALLAYGAYMFAYSLRNPNTE